MSPDDFYLPGHLLEPAYGERWSATLVQQLAAAVQRLAGELNVWLGTQ